MGTRHLIEVIQNGKLRVAQYGQWDGYPSGQGETIAKFLHSEMDEKRFAEKLNGCHFMTKQEIDAFNAAHKDSWQETHPWLSRDAGAKILSYIQQDGPLALVDQQDFKNDGLFCEFHYLVDMDAKSISVNGRPAIPFSEWTVERMASLEKEMRAERDSD